MQIESINIDEIIAYENNAKEHPREQIEQIKESIKEYGNNDPLAIDENNVVIEGHGRLLALKELEYEQVDIIRINHLSEEQKKAYRLVHNKLTMNSDFDLSKLEEELRELSLDNIDMSVFDFDLSFMEEINEVKEDNFEIELPEEPKSKLGDIYQLGNHRLMCGDSTYKEHMDKLINNNSIRCVFTSPPYNMGNDMYDDYEDNLQSKEYIKFNLDVVNNIVEHLNGFLFWNISYNKNSRWEFLEIANQIRKVLSFKEMIIWNKKKAMPVRSNDLLMRTYEDIFLYTSKNEDSLEVINLYESSKGILFNKDRNEVIKNYWEIVVDKNTQLEEHKACFPVALPSEAIKLTTDIDDNVLDCFGGSGTTLIACEQMNRNCLMMEYSPQYVDVIINRWETLTGKKAVLLND